MGRRRKGEDRRPAGSGLRSRLPLPGRAERRTHDRRRGRDLQDPADPVGDHRRQAERDRRRLRRRPRGAGRRARRPRGARSSHKWPALRVRETRTSSCPGTSRSTARASAGSAAFRSERPGGGSALPMRTRRRGSGSASRTSWTRRSCARSSSSRWRRRTSGSSGCTSSPRRTWKRWSPSSSASRSGSRRTSLTRRSSSIAHCAPASACCSKELRGRCSTWITAPIRS